MVPCERCWEDNAGVPWVERDDAGSGLVDTRFSVDVSRFISPEYT